MKKHVPNIILLFVVLVNLFFMGRYIWNNDLGMFLGINGIIFLVLGIVIFIFFLSVDPGYGWVKSIDLTKNYILIFTSMAVCMAGIVFIVIGQHMHELHAESASEIKRCQELIVGDVDEVLKRDWYSLRDQQNQESLSVYLFQKKSDRNNYKIIATVKNSKSVWSVRNFTITSDSIPLPITANSKESACPGVLERDISIDFDRVQDLTEQVRFKLLITIIQGANPEFGESGREEVVRFDLKTNH